MQVQCVRIIISIVIIINIVVIIVIVIIIVIIIVVYLKSPRWRNENQKIHLLKDLLRECAKAAISREMSLCT